MNIVSALGKICAALIALLLGTAQAIGAPPTISNLSLRGLQTGGVTTIAIEGADLLPEPRVVLAVPIAKQTLHAGGAPNHIEIEIALPAETPAGIYNLRIATPAGISNAQLIALDSLPQVGPVAQLPTLPAAISGDIGGGQVVRTAFALKKDQSIVVEVEARRIGGGLDPVLNLFDTRHVPLAWAEGSTALDGDARFRFTAPADGAYTVELHDAVFQAAAPARYRLKIGDFQFADLVFPPAVRAATKTPLQFSSSNFPPTTRAEFMAQLGGATVPAPWPSGSRPSGLRPGVLVTDVDEILKAQPADGSPQSIAAPVGISGRFDKPHAEDRYRLAVSPGTRLHLEVMASRIGSPLDGVLAVRDEHGNHLAMSDDQPGTIDPGLDYTVPAGVPAIVVALRDVAGRGGEDFVYHLSIARADQPSFALTVAEDRVQIPRGGSALLRIHASRTGYAGPIELTFDGLPPGITATSGGIVAGSDEAFAELTSAGDPSMPGVFTIRGTGHAAETTIQRVATVAGAINPVRRQPWLGTEIALGVVASPQFGLALDGIGGETTLTPGGKLSLHVKATRGAKTLGAIRLALVSSQPMPKKKVRVNKKDEEQDDVERSLRLDGSLTIPADKSDAAIQLLIPGDLPTMTYQLAIRGELLAADGKTVLATTYAPLLQAKALARAAK